MSLSTLDSRSLKKLETPRHAAKSPRFMLCVCGILAFVLSVVSVVLTILDTAALFAAHQSFRGLSVVATLFDILALATLLAFLIQVVYRQEKTWNSSKERNSIFLLAYAAPAVISIILTLVTYILTQDNITDINREVHGSWAGEMAAKFTLWVLSTLAQLSFYAVAIFLRPLYSESRYPTPADEAAEAEMREPTPPMTLDTLPGPTVPGSSLSSPSISNGSGQTLGSWRSSIQQVVRPMTSRTRLLSRQPQSLRASSSFYSDATSIRTTSHPDAFDSWDTSSIDAQTRDAVMQSTPTSCPDSTRNDIYPSTRLEPIPSARLEPIPGSRPVSPAHALDGPFLSTETLTIPEAPSPAFLSPTNSRPTTPTFGDANIHPLFRADSPAPPPVVTPGTVVTASPLSGQAISRTMASISRSRASSRAASRGGTTSPMPSSDPMISAQAFGDAFNKIVSASRNRSESPPCREMTPPIPEFILSEASPPATIRRMRSGLQGEMNSTCPTSPTSPSSLTSKPSLTSLRKTSFTLPVQRPSVEKL